MDTYQRNKKKINFGQTLSYKILVDWIAQSYTESCFLKIKFFMLFEIAHELISVSKRIFVDAYEAPDILTIKKKIMSATGAFC